MPSGTSPILLGALALLVGAAPPSPGAPAGAERLTQLREQARLLAAGRCGNCHSSKSPRALPKALKAFDIERSNWTSTLSDAQLGFVLERFKGAPPADIERVTAYVEAELAERKNQAQ